MAHAIEIEIPDGLVALELPSGVERRLQNLLSKQDEGQTLTHDEHAEAKGLVTLTESLSLLKLRAKRVAGA